MDSAALVSHSAVVGTYSMAFEHCSEAFGSYPKASKSDRIGLIIQPTLGYTLPIKIIDMEQDNVGQLIFNFRPKIF